MAASEERDSHKETEKRSAMRFWRPTSTMCTTDRAWWGTRAVSCSACGYDAKHFMARKIVIARTREHVRSDRVESKETETHVFGVPYAGHNGGIGREIDAEQWTEIKDNTIVFLSDCCEAPRFRK